MAFTGLCLAINSLWRKCVAWGGAICAPRPETERPKAPAPPEVRLPGLDEEPEDDDDDEPFKEEPPPPLIVEKKIPEPRKKPEAPEKGSKLPAVS